MAKSTVEFHFVGDSTAFQREAAKAQKALQQTGTIAKKAGEQQAAAAKHASGGWTLLKGALAGAGLVAFAEKSAHAFLDEQVATTKLQNTLKNNPQLAHASEKSFEDLAKSISYKTAADKESVLSGIAVLGQFKLNSQQLKEITPLVVDYARKTGKDVPDAAAAIGKGLLGNAKALKSIGINFKATGDAGKDYATILAALKSKVGGYAAEEEKSRHNIDVMQHRFHDLQVQVGGKLLSAFDFLVRNFKVLLPLVIAIGGALATVKIAKFAKDLSQAFSAIKTGGAKALDFLKGGFSNIPALAGPAAIGILAVGSAVFALAKAHQEDKVHAKEFADALEQQAKGSKDAVSALILQRLAQEGLLDTFNKLGINTGKVIAAFQGSATATDDLQAAFNKLSGSEDKLKLANLIQNLADGKKQTKEVAQATTEYNAALAQTAPKAKTAAVRILGMTQVDFKTWATGLTTQLNFVSGSLTTLGGNAKLSAKDVLKAFTDELTAMAQYKTNIDTIIKRHAPADLVKQLADMGEQGAPIVAALAHANKTQFDAIVGKWNAAGRVARGFPANVQAMATGVNRAIASIKGKTINIAVAVKTTEGNLIGGGAVRRELVGFASGGFVPGAPGAAQAAIVHGGEFVLSRKMLAALERNLSRRERSSGGDGVATATYVDSSVTNVYNPVPEKLSETLPALRRRKQILAGH